MMTVFVCTDSRGGMLFGGRRASYDMKIIEDVIRYTGDGILYISDFSEDLFSESEASVISVPDPMFSAGEDAFVFVEDATLSPYIDKIDRLVIYNFGEAYPFDVRLDIDPKSAGFKLRSRRCFTGISHNNVTREDYIK